MDWESLLGMSLDEVTEDVPAREVRRPALRYHGSKFRIAPWIIEHFPQHTCYVEPFAGGANVILRKQPSQIEVYNDLDGDVVNFFRVLREQTSALLRAIELTPYSREELILAFERTDDPLERARRCYIRSWQSWGGNSSQYHTGWRYQHSNNRGKSVVDDWNADGWWAAAARLKQVQIECDDAVAVIERYDQASTLFYVDPPYVHKTRSERGAQSRRAYKHEMTDEQHRALAEVLHKVKGMVVLSGYDSELYRELYSGWDVRCMTVRTQNPGKKAVECLWLSPAASRQGKQLAMFE